MLLFQQHLTCKTAKLEYAFGLYLVLKFAKIYRILLKNTIMQFAENSVI